MTRAFVVAALVGLAASPLIAGRPDTVRGSYVEARTAEVFTGGCIMGSEAGTVGKEAVLAWKVDRGMFNGVRSTACRSSPWSPAIAISASRKSAAGNRRRGR